MTVAVNGFIVRTRDDLQGIPPSERRAVLSKLQEQLAIVRSEHDGCQSGFLAALVAILDDMIASSEQGAE